MNGFWKNWMLVWCCATFGFGVVLVGAVAPGPDVPIRTFYDLIEWPLDGNVAFEPRTRFTAGVLGAVMIGWAITIFGMTKAAESGGAPVWRALTTAMLVWYLIDSALSVLSGYPLNAVSNTVFLVTYLLPVLATRALSK